MVAVQPYSQTSHPWDTEYSQYSELAHAPAAGVPRPDPAERLGPLQGPRDGDANRPLFTSLPVFDRFTGGFARGKVSLLHGTSPMLVEVGWRLVVRAAADFGWSTVIVDGGNLADVRGLLPVARQLGVHRDLVLPHTMISRAFTAYQLTTLFDRDLPAMVSDSCLVLVLAPGRMYGDPDMEASEARTLLKHSMDRVREVTRDSGAVTVMIEPGLGTDVWGKMVSRAADGSSVAVEQQGRTMVLDTGSHRVRWRPPPPGQMVLDGFGRGSWA